MAQVTIELRNVLKIKGFSLFDFDYGVEDDGWKKELERDVINYYMFYEIGSETVDRFKHDFKSVMQLIGPYYNEIYKTTVLDIDPLLTQHIIEKIDIDSDLIDDRSVGVEGHLITENLNVDYPQHSNISDDLPTNKSKLSDETFTTTNFTGNQLNVSNSIRELKGRFGNVGDMLVSYRKSIININASIIKELKTLFILVY